MTEIFNQFIYHPIFNALIFIYQNFSFGDFGVAIIILTILVRILLFPIFHKSVKNQAAMARLGPEIKKIQETYKQDREKQTRALLELYHRHQVNPLSGFLLILIQLPILFALYWTFLNGLSEEALKNLYAFIPRPESIDFRFLNLIDLKEESILIVALATAAQYWQGRLATPKTDKTAAISAAESVSRQMVYLGPILTAIVLSFLPAAVGLYWFVTSVVSAGQQILVNKSLKDGKFGNSSQKNS